MANCWRFLMSKMITELEMKIAGESDPYKKIDLKILLSRELTFVDLEKMNNLVKEIDAESKTFAYQKGTASCFGLKAMYSLKKDQYFEALEYADIAYEAFISLDYIEGQIRILRILSTIYGQLGKFDDSLNVCRKGLALIKEYDAIIIEENNIPIEFTFLNNIATTYGYSGRHAESLDFHLQAYEYLKKSDDGSAQVMFLCNLGQTYMENGNLELALEYINKGLAEANRLKSDDYNYHLCYCGLGLVYKKLGDFDQSMENLLMSLTHAASCSSKYGQAEVLIHLGKVSLAKKDMNSAIEYFKLSLKLSEEIKANELLRENHFLLAECFELEKDYETSIFHYKRHMEVYRKVISLELEQKMSEYTIDFKIEQAKKNAEVYKLKNVELNEKNAEIAKKAKELEESYHNISTLSLIGQKITASLDIEEVLSTIYENAKALMDVNIFGIGTFDELTGIIDYKMFIEESVRSPSFKSDIDNSDTIASKCILSKEAIVYNNMSEHPQLYTLQLGNVASKGKVPKSLIYYPLILGEKVIGTITFQSYKENAYSDIHLDAIKILASYIAIALNNSQKSQALQKAVSELEVFSKTDPLTELFNRRYMAEKISQECEKYKRSYNKFSIIITDIDFFKEVNDTYGHDCGDYILTELSELLKAQLRSQDYLARWGGEEFLILLTDTDVCRSAIMAERLRKRVMEHVFAYHDKIIKIEMTFGISEYNDEPSMEDTIKRADRALYRGKATGRNKCIINGIHNCHIENVEEM